LCEINLEGGLEEFVVARLRDRRRRRRRLDRINLPREARDVSILNDGLLIVYRGWSRFSRISVRRVTNRLEWEGRRSDGPTVRVGATRDLERESGEVSRGEKML